MLTIFSIPKAFHGHINIIQRNAIQSWLRLQPACEVILCGDAPGIVDVAQALGTRVIPEIDCNEYGTPLLKSAFAQAQRIASNDLMCYVNADIILLSDFMTALQKVKFPRFLLVGQRCDIDMPHPIDFGLADWEQSIRTLAAKSGALRPPDWIDYFVFRRDTYGEIPTFAVGRPIFDNWLIYRARALRMPVIDATQAVKAIHQNHDYSHVLSGSGNTWEGPEAERNRALVVAGTNRSWKAYRFLITDATHKTMPDGRIVKALDGAYLERKASRQAVLDRHTGQIARFKHRLIGWIGRHRVYFPGWLWRVVIDHFAN